MKQVFKSLDEERRYKLKTANKALVVHFMGLGKTQAEAEAQAITGIGEVAQYIYPYTLGITQPLFDAINANTLPYMKAEEKALVIAALS